MYWPLESNSLSFFPPKLFHFVGFSVTFTNEVRWSFNVLTCHSTYDVILITFLACFLVSAPRLWVPWRQGPLCNPNVCLVPWFRPSLPLVGQLRWSFNWSPCPGLALVFFNLSSTLLAAAVLFNGWLNTCLLKTPQYIPAAFSESLNFLKSVNPSPPLL